jgi:hypothetical protein
VREHLTHKLRESLDALNRAASGDSLCTLKGERVETAKYLEGQVVAIKSLIKLVDQQADSELSTLLALAKEAWLARNPEDFSHAPSWVSYRLGGIDVLEGMDSFPSGK